MGKPDRTVRDAVPDSPEAVSVAVTVTGPPAETPRTTPAASTGATPPFELCHVTPAASVRLEPSEYWPTASRRRVNPAGIDTTEGETASERSVGGVTVRTASPERPVASSVA